MTSLRRSVFGIFDVTLPAVLHKPLTLPALPSHIQAGIKELLNTPISIPGMPKAPKSRKKIVAKKPQNNASKNNVKAKAGQFLIEGLIECGQRARFMVAEKEFDIDANTWIIGNVEYGAFARVKGVAQGDKKIATQLVILRGAPANEG